MKELKKTYLKLKNIKLLINDKKKLRKLYALLSIDLILALLTFGNGLLFINLMQKEAVAEFTYISLIMNHASLILTMGTYVVLIKNYSSSKGQREKISEVGRLFYLSILIAPIFIIVLYFSANEIKSIAEDNNINVEQFGVKYLIIVMAVIIGAFNINLYSFCVAIKNIKAINYIKILKFITSTIVTLIILTNTGETNQQVIGRILSILVSELVVVALCYKMILIIFKKSSRIKLPHKKDFRLFGSLTLIAIFNFLQQTIDKTFLLSTGDVSSLADYSVALLFLSPLPMIVAAYQNIWVTEFFAQKNLNMAKVEIVKVFWRSTIILIGMAIAISLIAQSILMLELLPSSYKDLFKDVCMLSPYVIITALMQYLYNMFMYIEKPKYQLYLSIINTVILYGISSIIVPEFGKQGAIISVIVSVIITMGVGWCIIYVETKGKVE